MHLQDLIKTAKIIILATIVTLGANFAYAAWSSPTANPPGNNAPAPINVGSAAQEKAGDLNLGGALAVSGRTDVSNPLWATFLGSSGSAYINYDLRVGRYIQAARRIDAPEYCDQNGRNCKQTEDLYSSNPREYSVSATCNSTRSLTINRERFCGLSNVHTDEIGDSITGCSLTRSGSRWILRAQCRGYEGPDSEWGKTDCSATCIH